MRKIVSALQAFFCLCLLTLFPLVVQAGIGDADYCPPPDTIPFVHNGITYDYIVQVKGWDLKQYFFYGVSSNPKPVMWSFEHNPYHALAVEGAEPFRVATLSSSTDCSGTVSDLYIPGDGNYYNFIIYDGEPYFFSGGTNNIDYIIRSTVALTGTVNIAASVFGGGPVFDMKMPLPGGKSWLLTTETGGTTCIGGGGTDTYHTNTNNGYFSLDFDDISKVGSQATQEFSVPIYAAAAGIVASSGYGYDANGFGFWVMIDHQNGYKTRYAHMVSETLVTSGAVTQGQRLGTVGTTPGVPYSTGTHLHFQLYYNGSSLSTDSALASVRMEGMALEAYDVSTGGCSSYYPSTNTQ